MSSERLIRTRSKEWLLQLIRVPALVAARASILAPAVASRLKTTSRASETIARAAAPAPTPAPPVRSPSNKEQRAISALRTTESNKEQSPHMRLCSFFVLCTPGSRILRRDLTSDRRRCRLKGMPLMRAKFGDRRAKCDVARRERTTRNDRRRI